MKIKNIFIFLSFMFVAPTLHAQLCEQNKNTAGNTCDESQLKAIQTEFEKAKADAAVAESGALTDAQRAKLALELAIAKNTAFQNQCGQALDQCMKSCMSEAQNPPTMAQAQEGIKECSQGKPKQTKDESQKTGADMGQALQGIAGLISALAGLKGEEGSKDPCDPATSGRTALEIKNDPSCTLDEATSGSGDNFVAGERRRSTGSAGVDSPVNPDGVAMGAAGKTDLSKASSGGGGGGAFGGGGGIGSPAAAAAAGKDGGKDDKLNVASANGSGGGRGGSVGSGAGAKPGSGTSGMSKTSYLDDRTQLQALVDKAISNRAPASEGGEMGGVSGAHGLDNFLKVEKRMQNERNTLSEH